MIQSSTRVTRRPDNPVSTSIAGHSLFADRLSTETMRSSQLRLYLSSLAYLLVCALRRLALPGTEWAEAHAATIRLRPLKIAARVRVTARRIWVSYSSAYAWRSQFEAAFAALRNRETDQTPENRAHRKIAFFESGPQCARTAPEQLLETLQ